MQYVTYSEIVTLISRIEWEILFFAARVVTSEKI